MTSKALVSASLRPFVLSILSEGENYGYEIIQRVSHATGGALKMTTGSLYPLLHNLENKGLLKSVWRDVGSGPRRKYYRITAKGRKELQRDKQEWVDITVALNSLWGPPAELATT
jgi:PadR family transcriptional regulator